MGNPEREQSGDFAGFHYTFPLLRAGCGRFGSRSPVWSLCPGVVGTRRSGTRSQPESAAAVPPGRRSGFGSGRAARSSDLLFLPGRLPAIVSEKKVLLSAVKRGNSSARRRHRREMARTRA